MKIIYIKIIFKNLEIKNKKIITVSAEDKYILERSTTNSDGVNKNFAENKHQ